MVGEGVSNKGPLPFSLVIGEHSTILSSHNQSRKCKSRLQRCGWTDTISGLQYLNVRHAHGSHSIPSAKSPTKAIKPLAWKVVKKSSGVLLGETPSPGPYVIDVECQTIRVVCRQPLGKFLVLLVYKIIPTSSSLSTSSSLESSLKKP